MQQPNLFSSSAGNGPAVISRDGQSGEASARSDSPASTQNGTTALPRPRKRRRWVVVLLLAEFLLAITVRIFIGVIVMVLPWSPLWDNNHLLQALPHLSKLLSYGAMRGIISGIGLINLWIAVDDTLHREERRP